VNNSAGIDRERRNQYLAALREDRCFDSYVELEAPPYPQPRAKLSGLLIWPPARNWLLREARRAYCNHFAELINDLEADLCIVSDRLSLFLVPEMKGRAATMIDWCDCAALYQVREIRRLFSSFEMKSSRPRCGP